MIAAKKAFELCVLNFAITSNHIHLLILDCGHDAGLAIPRSLHLAAARVAQEFNIRKNRRGAFWEDRYHATAVETGEHFTQCLTYIDLNMVRARVVDHPGQWPFGGYHELMQPRKRIRNQLVDWRALAGLLNIRSLEQLREARESWVRTALQAGPAAFTREPKWTESVAIGSKGYVDEIIGKLEVRAKGKAEDREGRGEEDGTGLLSVGERKEAYLRVFGVKNEELSPIIRLLK